MDWRRRDCALSEEEHLAKVEGQREALIDDLDRLSKVSPQSRDFVAGAELPEGQQVIHGVKAPQMYFVDNASQGTWNDVVSSFPSRAGTAWGSQTLSVYGRQIIARKMLPGVAYWDFTALCSGFLGPADYITMASTFHTMIIDGVPILTLSLKNEARRFITLLDAMYEARCKLILRAAAGPDELFFPETDRPSEAVRDEGDAVYSETLAEVYQDQTSPFRPNISSYEGGNVGRSGYDPDEDSDFGPVAGAGIGRGVDFGETGSFTGEDERFAYKRARSRLWEMCGARWHARQGDWWRPLPPAARRWERVASGRGDGPAGKDTSTASSSGRQAVAGVSGDVRMGEAQLLDRPAGLQGRE
jgi:protein AFG1